MHDLLRGVAARHHIEGILTDFDLSPNVLYNERRLNHNFEAALLTAYRTAPGEAKDARARSRIRSIDAVRGHCDGQLRDAVLDAIRSGRTIRQVAKLNPIIRGWAAYYWGVVSSEEFTSLDNHVWKLVYKWARHTHPNKPRGWVTARYFGRFNTSRQDRWVFGDRETGRYLAMPPEQASGHPHVTPAADVYGLGTVLLYAAAGHYPYDGSRWEAIVAQVTNPQIAPDLSGVPSGLKPLLVSMLAHDPEDRPKVGKVAQACAELLASAGTTPADARLALIASTAAENASRVPGKVLSPSFERLLEDRIALADAEDAASPLDAPPGGGEAGEAGAEEEQPEPEPTELLARQKTVSRPRPARLPASGRVAQELRAEYAVHPAL